MTRIVHGVSRSLALLAALCVVVLMLSTSLDVGRRALTGRSVRGVVEYSEVFMVALVFLGLAYAHFRKEHVSVTLFMSRLPLRTSGVLRAAGLLVMLGFLLWMTAATSGEALRSIAAREYRFGLLRVPIWPARLAIPVGIVALMLETCLDLRDCLVRPPPVRVQDAAGPDGAQAAL